MICFVILHYQNVQVTYQCIDYLLQLSKINETRIVVIDNASPNNSGREIDNKYRDNSLIKVLINEENLGFAKGNNIGYSYAKNVLHAECVVVMNSDIYITDTDFIKKLQSVLIKYNDVSVLAPDVINISGIHCNPMIVPPIDEFGIKKIYKDSLVRYILYSIPVVNKLIWIHTNNKKKERTSKGTDRKNWDKEQYNIVPDGSCIIFMPEWIKHEDFAFVPITFMYAEEHILYEYVNSHKYKSLYYPELKVNHMEGATTIALSSINSNKGIVNKRKNLKWHMDACKIYLNYKKEIIGK